jgi:APA family basic amino acid/polyamine antiporter
VIIGNVIGTGVFLKARVMTCNVGSPGWVIVVWVAAGLLSLAGALTYAELTAMKPFAGAEYVLLRDAYGRVSSFLYGWKEIFIAKPASQAAVAVVSAIAINDLLDGKLQQTLLQTSVFGAPYEITTLQIVALMMIIIFTTLNCASVVLSGQIATALTFVKIGLVVFVAVGAFVFATGGDFGHFQMLGSGGTCEGVADTVRFGSPEYTFFSGFAAAMLGALWGYDGWNNLTYVAGEVKDPNRNIPIALIGSVVAVIVLYVTAQVAYFYVLDPTTVASISKNSSVAATVVGRFFSADGAALGTGIALSIFAVGLMLSSLGTLQTSLLAGSRTPYAMARDGMMFPILKRLSITGVPVASVIFQGILACILALSGSFDTLTDYFVFGNWIFYALITSSIFVFRKRFPEAERPYRAFGYPVVPVLFLFVAGWLLYRTIVDSPTQSIAGLILIGVGLPVYYFLNNKYGGMNGSSERDVVGQEDEDQ